MIAEFCTELAGKKKEPNYKKILELEAKDESTKLEEEKPIESETPIEEKPIENK